MQISDSISARTASNRSPEVSSSEASTRPSVAGGGVDSFERVAQQDDPSLWKIVRDRVMGDVAPAGVSDGAGAAEALVEIQKSGLPMKMNADHLRSIVFDPTMDPAVQNRAQRLLESANQVPGGDIGHALQWQQKNAKELQAVLKDARAQGWDY